jgi:hypothetical protein
MKIPGILFLLAGASLLCGCSVGPVENPFTSSQVHPSSRAESFRTELARLINAGDFEGAVAFLRSSDPARQAAFDKTGYLAVGEDMVVLPGVRSGVRYDPARDWFIPGTSDVVRNPIWQQEAREFAAAYNKNR